MILARYWIIVISEENWEVVREKCIYGAPESFRSPTEIIKPGDVVIFYVKKKGSKRLGGKFVGAFKVVSEWHREVKPLWPDEIRESRVKYPWRIKLEPIKFGIADFRELASKLTFIVRKERPHAYLIGTPANLRRPIPESDAKLILNSME